MQVIAKIIIITVAICLEGIWLENKTVSQTKPETVLYSTGSTDSLTAYGRPKEAVSSTNDSMKINSKTLLIRRNTNLGF